MGWNNNYNTHIKKNIFKRYLHLVLYIFFPQFKFTLVNTEAGGKWRTPVQSKFATIHTIRENRNDYFSQHAGFSSTSCGTFITTKTFKRVSTTCWAGYSVNNPGHQLQLNKRHIVSAAIEWQPYALWVLWEFYERELLSRDTTYGWLRKWWDITSKGPLRPH